MSTPTNDEKACKVAIFDSFSKTVMKNASRNIVQARKQQQKKETVSTESMQYLFDSHYAKDTYPSEHLLEGGDGAVCLITTEWLYQVMVQLPEKQKEVLLLEYWYGLKGREIGEILNVSDRTVYDWKKKAFQAIREYYERNT